MNIQPKDFEFISELIRKESAIVLESGKEYLVESRLSPIASEEGFDSLEQLVTALRGNKKFGLKGKVVEALTTNETSFYRDIEPFEMMRTQLIPELLEMRKAEKALTVWCGAASTGQELYSLAMMIREHFPELLSWKLTILGTDLSKEVLDKAKEGKYSQVEINRGLPAQLLIKYFEKQGTEWQLKKDVRDMIEYRELNLIKPWIGVPQSDIVLLRNVLIYFDAEVKKEILGKVRRVLRPDGFLFLGAAETTLNLDENYARRTSGRGSCYTIKKD